MATETLQPQAAGLLPITPNAPSDLQLDDYTVMGPTGKGKFSDVFKASRNGQLCALKKFSKDCMESQGLRRRVEEEIKLLQSLDHPNIVKHRGMFHGPDGEMFIELEWADGGDLRQLLKRHKSNNAHFAESRVWLIFTQIARGVYHMHQSRIMHRDLKPANILVMRDLTVKVADLGLSKRMSELTQEMHSRVGTPLYMAPEVLNNQGYSFSSDVWSMGCILYEIAALVSPFRSGSKESEEKDDDLVNLVNRITSASYPPLSSRLPYSETLRDLIARILVPIPQDRATCADVLEVAESQNKLLPGSVSPPISWTSKSSPSASYAASASNTNSMLSSRESSRASPPLSSPRTSFSEFVGAEKSRSTASSSDASSKLRPPALSIPGDANQTTFATRSPQSARVLTYDSPSARFRVRRFSADLRSTPSNSNEALTAPVVHPGAGRPLASSIQTTSIRSGVPQSPRLSRLVSAGTVLSPSPSSPNSPRPNTPLVYQTSASSNHPMSPRSARLPLSKSSQTRLEVSGPIRHRRSVSVNNVESSEENRSPRTLLANSILAPTRESSGSEVSSPTLGTVVSDDDERRSQNEGARSRAALHALSIATDKQSLTTQTSAAKIQPDPNTAPATLKTHSSSEIRRFSRTMVPSGEVYSSVAKKFPLTPTAASEPMVDVVHHQRSNSNPFSLNFATDEPETAPHLAKMASDSAVQDVPALNTGSTFTIPPPSENPFATGGALLSMNLNSPHSASILQKSRAGSTLADIDSPRTAGNGAAPSSPFKFSLWSNAGAKKRSQATADFTAMSKSLDTSPNQPRGESDNLGLSSANMITPHVEFRFEDSGELSRSSPLRIATKVESEPDEFPYLLGAVIGEGSFAKVYRAVDPETGLSVAVKQMHFEEADSESAAQMEKEIGFLKTLSHPNLVKYIGVRRMNNKLNIILEFCTEGSISSMLRMYKRFPDRLIRLYTKQMVDALIYLHENNIVHRDIKGGNVLVQGDGARGIVKLSDFGCSKKLATSKNLEKSTKMRGTVLWMAPEAANQREDVGTPSDIWSLGATVIEMATGKPPWQQEGLVDEIPALIAIATTKVPPSFPVDHLSDAGINFLRCCMEVDPKARWSAKQLALHEFFVLEQTVQVATAEVGRRPEVVGASYNALRAAVKGRDLLLEREQLVNIRMRKAIDDLMKGITQLNPYSACSKVFTRDVEIDMPVVLVPVAGLPCLYAAQDEKDVRIHRLVDFETRVQKLLLLSPRETLDRKTPLDDSIPDGQSPSSISIASSPPVGGGSLFHFVASNIRNAKELIQVESRTAMWKWEIRGHLATAPERIRIASGSAMATFDPSGQYVKTIEFVWDPTAFLEKLGLVSALSPRNNE